MAKMQPKTMCTIKMSHHQSPGDVEGNVREPYAVQLAGSEQQLSHPCHNDKDAQDGCGGGGGAPAHCAALTLTLTIGEDCQG